jgi:hypothetical protein
MCNISIFWTRDNTAADGVDLFAYSVEIYTYLTIFNGNQPIKTGKLWLFSQLRTRSAACALCQNLLCGKLLMLTDFRALVLCVTGLNSHQHVYKMMSDRSQRHTFWIGLTEMYTQGKVSKTGKFPKTSPLIANLSVLDSNCCRTLLSCFPLFCPLKAIYNFCR